MKNKKQGVTKMTMKIRSLPGLSLLVLVALPACGSAAWAATETSRETPRGTASVRPHLGVPTLFIHGRPDAGMAFASYAAKQEVFGDFAKAGVHLFSFVATPTGMAYHGQGKLDVWISPGEFDYTPFDERVDRVLKADPQAFIFPRLSLCAPDWWADRHPQEIALGVDAQGRTAPIVVGGKRAPSWASEVWRRDTVAGLRRLIEHVEQSPFADRIIGYHLVSGTTEEWMAWGANRDIWGDYSQPNLRRFRSWLQDKYHTEKALQAAWHRVDASFETAQIPSRKLRQATTWGSLRRPRKEQAVIDYYLYNSDLVVETIELLAHAVKQATHDRKITGVFYGYLLQLDGEQRLQNAGHLALGRLLRCPHLDFLSSPTSYKFRQLGGAGTCHYMAPLDSVRLHGKLWFNENDIRTSITPRVPVGRWGKPANIAGDLLQHEKETAHAMTSGAAQWWFDVGGIRHDHPALLQRYARLVENAQSVLTLDRTPVNEIAFVVDDKSAVYMRVGDPLSAQLLTQQLPDLHRLGAPVGHYLACDLPHLNTHKLLIFANCLAPSDGERAAADQLKADGRWLLFHYASGLYADGRLDPRAMESFTGIRMAIEESPVPLRVALENSPALPQSLHGVTYGPGRPVHPVFIPQDPEAEVLGRLPDGRPGLVVKRFPDWTAVYSAVPVLPRDLLRWFARQAGVHFYIDTPDVVWANRDMLAISVKRPGPRTIHLPAARDVADLFRGVKVARGTREFSAEFTDKATRVFVFTPPQ